MNPQATIPTLDDDGTILWQSLAIIEYLDTRYPSPRLIPHEPVRRARVQALAQLIACEVHPLNNLRVLSYLRGELKLDEAAVAKWYSHWVAEAFGPLETLVCALQRRPLLLRRFAVARRRLPRAADVQRAPLRLRSRRRIRRSSAIAAGLDAEPAFARAGAPAHQPDAKSSATRRAASAHAVLHAHVEQRLAAAGDGRQRRVDRARQLGGIVDAARPRVGRFGDLRELRRRL